MAQARCGEKKERKKSWPCQYAERRGEERESVLERILGVRKIERHREKERDQGGWVGDQGATLFWFTAYYHHNPLSCFPLCSPGTPLASSPR